MSQRIEIQADKMKALEFSIFLNSLIRHRLAGGLSEEGFILSNLKLEETTRKTGCHKRESDCSSLGSHHRQSTDLICHVSNPCLISLILNKTEDVCKSKSELQRWSNDRNLACQNAV
jgi:hypothetical protein